MRHAADPEPIIAEGAWHGTIVDAPRGTGGFGYDPHFLDAATGLTAAELPLEQKNELVASRQGDARADRAGSRPKHELRSAEAWVIAASFGGSPMNARTIATSLQPIAVDAGDRSSIAARFAALPPLALYVHVPWCLRKCPYCDFNSHEARGESPEDAYVDALLADLEFALPSIWGRRVVTVFIGGGTPSLLSAAAIDRLLAGIRARVPLAPDAEITLEANPGTFEREKFAGFRAAGVNRLSLGIQSFDPKHLVALGRVHDAREARARGRGGARDLRQRQLRPDVRAAASRRSPKRRPMSTAALAFAPPHLSFYHLTLEPNTLFHRYPPPLPDDETAADIEDAVHARLAAAGYRHYETSAFARPGCECRHNLNYWRFGDYLGIGAGAHSKLSFADRIVRQVRWQAAEAVSGAGRRRCAGAGGRRRHAEGRRLRVHAECAAPDRRRSGGAVRRTHGLSAGARATGTRGAEARGLLERDPAMLRPTALGRRFLNDLQQLFLA